MKTEIEIIKNGVVKETTVNYYPIGWAMFPFFTFNDKFIDIKSQQYDGLREKDSQCWFCKESFKRGDEMGLVFLKTFSNVLSCKKCIDDIHEKTGIEISKRKYDPHRI